MMLPRIHKSQSISGKVIVLLFVLGEVKKGKFFEFAINDSPVFPE